MTSVLKSLVQRNGGLWRGKKIWDGRLWRGKKIWWLVHRQAEKTRAQATVFYEFCEYRESAMRQIVSQQTSMKLHIVIQIVLNECFRVEKWIYCTLFYQKLNLNLSKIKETLEIIMRLNKNVGPRNFKKLSISLQQDKSLCYIP